MALSRNIGHAGCAVISSALDTEAGRQVMASWEVLVAANWIMDGRRWYKAHYSMLDLEMQRCEAPGGGRDYSWEIHALRSDAGHTSDAKAHVAQVSSTFKHVDIDVGETFSDVDIELIANRSKYAYACILKLPHKCGATEVRAMTLEQAKFIGVQPWSNDDYYDHRDWNGMHLKFFLFVSDQGGDTKGTHPIIEQEIRDMPNVLYVRDWCCRHESALIQGKVLKRMEDGAWWRIITKTVNTWRQVNGVTKMLAALANKATPGHNVAARVWKRFPPRPLRGRWGAVRAASEHINDCAFHLMCGSRAKFVDVFKDSFVFKPVRVGGEAQLRRGRPRRSGNVQRHVQPMGARSSRGLEL